ncbi:adenylate/guanylate cyclase domain-containing protein, partial [Roseateles sp. P5_E7]
MDVAAWLRELGLAQYVQAFEAHDVDAQTLRHLTESDLTELGVRSVGHRRKLAAAIAALQQQPLAVQAPGTAAAQVGLAEQRQLTVLYAQMGAQGAGVDAEALREVVQHFIKGCTHVVSEYDGHVANFYGDCMLAYFGWPQAHEDDAERAVRAGLALVRRARSAADGVDMRVGIATGPVVVGDLIHEGPARHQSAVGLTPNLAARVLSLAKDGQVLIDALTRQLVGRNFGLQPLGSHLLKGIAQPVSACAVLDEQAADSRFDLLRGREMAPMAGRDRELAMLLERWSQARSGEGHLVLLEGEAGIGKSRITRALLDACAVQPHWRVRWQCSPYHAGSPL